ncbi:MAG TPA: carboxypeptidase regulatory-like domain-containing protein [Gemmatimonadales bacterium]
MIAHHVRFVLRLVRCFAGAALSLACLSIHALHAQETTGKIEGTVRDQAGTPIPGATVLVVGSAYSSTSNEQGYYFINNVAAGVMTVRAQFIGYAPSEVRNVRVLAGQTMTVNVNLEQRAVIVGDITVTVEANPIVPRDQVSSKPIVAGDLIQELPADNVQQVLRLQPGVVESDRGLSIRGGRIGEAIIYVDGVPVRSVSGRTGTGMAANMNMAVANGGIGTNVVGTNGVEEVSVTTGAIGAAQGDAQSGVISFVTRSGGEHYTGALSLSSDEIGGQTYGSGTNRLEASLGGPLMHNLKFFVSTVMQGQQSAVLGKDANASPLYVLDGVDTTVTIANSPGVAGSDSSRVALPRFSQYSSGQRRPDNWQDNWNVDGKLTYTYGHGSRVSASVHHTINQGLNFRGTTPGAGIYDPQSQTGFLNQQNIAVLNWTQDLSRSAERAFNIDAAFSYQGDRSTSGLVDQSWFSSHHNPTGGFSFSNMPFMINMDNFPLDDRLIQNIRVNNCQGGRDAARPDIGACIPYLNRSQDFLPAAPFRTNPYGVTAAAYPSSGTGNSGPSLSREDRITGRLAADWQLNRFNRMQFGGDFVRSDVFTFTSNLTSQIFMDAAHYKPNRMGLYAQDRLDLGDVVIDLGLRYDRLNSNVLFPEVAGRIFSDPLRAGTSGLAKVLTAIRDPNNDFNPGDTTRLIAQATATANACQSAISAADTTAWSTCNLAPGAVHSSLAPSIRVSFPVTDRTGFRLSYAQQTQTPEFQRYAASVNTDLAITNTNSVWGQDIGYGKTILFEFGVRHAFSADMVLDVAAYNKDKVSDVTGRVLPYFDYFTGTQQAIDLYTNQDFGNVRGVDVKLDRRVGSLFQGSLAYTFQSSKSTGSDPTEYLNSYGRQISAVTGDREAAPQAILTTADNRTHTIAGSLVLNLPHGWHQGTAAGSIFGGFGAFATFRFASGLAYTPFFNTGAGPTGPGNGFGLTGNPSAPLNSSTTPWIKNVDLRLTRDFGIAHSRSFTVFADFRNLFNWTNITGLFVETGDIVNSKFAANQAGFNSSAQSLLRSEAGSLYTTKTINGVATQGIDLSNCAAFNPTQSNGVPDCIMLRRAESRFADANDAGGGNLFFSQSEIDRSYSSWYDHWSGPQTFYGPGLNIRFGFDFNF